MISVTAVFEMFIKAFCENCRRKFVWSKKWIVKFKQQLDRQLSKTDHFRTQPNPLNAKLTKWSNTLKQFLGNFWMNCLSVFDHFVGLALKGLSFIYPISSQGYFSIPLKTSTLKFLMLSRGIQI